MRIDQFLKRFRIVRQRSVAKELCDAECVHIDGRPAKPSQLVQAGDVITLRAPTRRFEARVLEVPRGNVAKRDAAQYLEVLRDEHIDLVHDVEDANDSP